MPKIWIPNVEEILPERDINYEKVFVPKILEIFPRFVYCLNRGDKIISPTKIDPLFLNYASKVCSLGKSSNWFLIAKFCPEEYSIVDFIIRDKNLIEFLKAISKRKKYTIEPFIETPKVMRVSYLTGIPTDKTSLDLILNGVITKLNDKATFKKTILKLGIDTVEGYIVNSMPAAEKAIKLIAGRNSDKIMLKKSFYGGGLGNIAGNRDYLIKVLPEWYSGGWLLVEPFLNIKKVYGSLCLIKSNGVKFIGVDEQFFCDGKWVGFDYPSQDVDIIEKIKYKSLIIANEFFKQGARGFANIDWATTIENPLKPLALECNFRNNGFNYVLDFALRYFKVGSEQIKIRYRENVWCNGLNVANLLDTLDKIKIDNKSILIKSPGQKEGIVLMTPPSKNKYTLGIFSESLNFIEEVTLKMQEAGF